jgi:hypothetical protein
MSAKTPNPTDKYVGNRIHMRRLLVGMSQQALGEELGLTFQQVQTFLKEYEVITEGSGAESGSKDTAFGCASSWYPSSEGSASPRSTFARGSQCQGPDDRPATR